MPNRPRKHHHHPIGYLSGFTISGERTDRLYVFDQGQIKSWPSSPEEAGHERDYYAVYLDSNVDPYFFEKEVLAPLDGAFSRVLRETIISKRQLPKDRDFDVLLNFVVAMMTRTPRARQLVAKSTDLALQGRLRHEFASEQGWQRLMSCWTGPKLNVADEAMLRQGILEGQISYDLDQTSHVQKIVELVDAILPLLAQRIGRWALRQKGHPILFAQNLQYH